MILFLSTGQSALQLSASDEARGKVMALWAMTLSSSAPLGHFLAGWFAQRVGVLPVFIAMTGAVGAVTGAVVGVALIRGWRVHTEHEAADGRPLVARRAGSSEPPSGDPASVGSV
jgi:hypothetical protein